MKLVLAIVIALLLVYAYRVSSNMPASPPGSDIRQIDRGASPPPH